MAHWGGILYSIANLFSSATGKSLNIGTTFNSFSVLAKTKSKSFVGWTDFSAELELEGRICQDDLTKIRAAIDKSHSGESNPFGSRFESIPGN